MITYVAIVWAASALWVLRQFFDTKSEWIAAIVAACLGPLWFIIHIICLIFIEEKYKWEVSSWYRDNWTSREYTIDTEGDEP